LIIATLSFAAGI